MRDDSRQLGRPGEISRDSVVRTYRCYAPVYDWLFGAALEPGRRALGRAVGALHPDRVLEVGVGTGLALRHYPSAAAVTGIDLSTEMIEIARARLARLRGRRIELRTMNAEDMDFPDQAFDCVTLPYVLSVTPDPQRLYAEVRRVCRRGGAILILNHFSGSGYWQPLERAMRAAAARIGFRSDFSYAEHIEAHDWDVRRVTKVNFGGLSRLVEICNS